MINLESVRRLDYVCVALFTIALFGIVLAAGGPLTLHEGVLSQTTKAMLANHDWIVPRYGDAPWLERPPLPQWLSCVICTVLGHCDQEWQMRIGPALAGLTTVLITTWLAGRLFGRVTGILSGLMLATMYNFLRYSTLAEADVFLSPIVAAALGCFAYAEILAPSSPNCDRIGILSHVFGARPWCVFGFFVFLGMTNLAKGLVFGTVIVLAPVGIYLLWNFSWASVTRYMWLWGWLAFFAVALPWPLLVINSGYEDAIDVWKFDLFGRLNQNYLAEPAWYYFACLSWVPQPWTIPAFVGMAVTFRKLWRRSPLTPNPSPPEGRGENAGPLTPNPSPPAGRGENAGPLTPNPSPPVGRGEPTAALRFVWCWAWMPILVFSLSQGKHHHYMIHYLAPWAILSALGTVWAWQRIAVKRPNWRPEFALVGSFALLFVLLCGGFIYKGAYLHRSREDTEFLLEVRRKVPLDQPLMINSAEEALEGLRMQFYIGESVYFLHNLSFVRDDRVNASDIYVVTRYNRLPHLEKYGHVEVMLKCKRSRRERSEEDRWTLFRVHLREDFERKNARVRISPMQAMYRDEGPDLE